MRPVTITGISGHVRRNTQKVAFEDKYLQPVVGTIVRINSRTATIDPGDGTQWRVGFSLLRHVLDV